jgi:hypothetical protein
MGRCDRQKGRKGRLFREIDLRDLSKEPEDNNQLKEEK